MLFAKGPIRETIYIQYQDEQPSWLSSPEHTVECQLIHLEHHQLTVASLGIEPAQPTNQVYGVRFEV